MPDHRNTKYGTAHSCRFFVCPDEHVHVIGYGRDGESEYEIVLGKSHQQKCMVAIRAVQMNQYGEVTEIE